ncbi:hypothetical protein [Grimontia sedimenti]|uniref:hypothetical protein n=1 Tax=Grimontia sedimenti TaxID=2711294 RepID=UPI00197B018D|nr:hypothetical protein [Grimontia sedimenti]
MFGRPKFVKIAGGVVLAIMIWFMFTKLNVDKGVIANLNGVKREFALAAAGLVLMKLGGGERFTLIDLINRSKHVFGVYKPVS